MWSMPFIPKCFWQSFSCLVFCPSVQQWPDNSRLRDNRHLLTWKSIQGSEESFHWTLCSKICHYLVLDMCRFKRGLHFCTSIPRNCRFERKTQALGKQLSKFSPKPLLRVSDSVILWVLKRNNYPLPFTFFVFQPSHAGWTPTVSAGEVLDWRKKARLACWWQTHYIQCLSIILRWVCYTWQC